ncbi:MAG: MarR family transcriptional regulator [Pseudomonadales bacterium]|jgi:DNA-binding MarR family transcriptional regulator|nr:MarR family transcriptional regulator [Pseudomonadales bacterium]
MARRNTDTLFTFFNEISIISQLATAMFEQQLPHELTISQFSVLNWFVRVDTQATPTRLARAFQVTGGAMTNTLKKLEAKGFARVQPDASSGRQKLVTMTPAGRSARDESIAAIEPLLSEFAREFPATGLQHQTRQLAEVRAYLDEYRFRETT